MYFSVMFFFFAGTNNIGGHIGQFSLHLSHQGNKGFSLSQYGLTS